MLGKSLASPVLTFGSAHYCTISKPDIATSSLTVLANSRTNVVGGAWTSVYASRKWELQSAAKTEILVLNFEERNLWEACRQALNAFNFSAEEEEKILGKAFGHVHSPYWGEERKKEIPRFEIVNEILDYLRSLGLSDDDLVKLLKKFPEVLGCRLNDELKINVQILDKDWGIKGKPLETFFFVIQRFWVIMWIVRETAWHNARDAGFGFNFCICCTISTEFFLFGYEVLM